MSGSSPDVPSAVLSSPTFSAATTSSYDVVSLPDTALASTSNEESDDEIVWSVSSGHPSPSAGGSESSFVPLFEDDDYVVLSRRRSPACGLSAPRTPRPDDLVQSMNKLSVSTGEQTSGKQCNGSKPSSSTSPKPNSLRKKRRKGSGSVRSASPAASTSQQQVLVPMPTYTGLGSRPVVDDLSETLDNVSVTDDESVVSSMYEDAVNYITSFLSNPTNDSVSMLTFLQSLIIELGLATPNMPSSLTSARAVLRSNAFLNIRDYLAVRREGLSAIKGVMYPSKTALIKDIRRRKNTAPLRWVKQNGLQVLLVSCYR